MEKQLLKKFQELYGEGGDIRSYFSPGRVNLIGEHTDYNGGHVFPCALTIGTYGVARKREDRKIHLKIFVLKKNTTGQTIQRELSGPLKKKAMWQIPVLTWLCMEIFQTVPVYLLLLP